MSNNISIPVIKAIQPIGEVYLAKIEAQNLLKLSSVDRRHIDEDDEIIGIQRPLKQDKVREIKKYLTTQNATFPNTIIVNVKEQDVLELHEDRIIIRESEEAFTIIDGQHRLYGFEGYNGKPFELLLTIFVGLETSLQSEVFSIINSQQTKVDPSLNINLELSEITETPRKKIVQIAQSFNIDKQSPWHQQIKMLGSQSEGMLSLSSFARPLFNLTYPERLYIEIKNRLKAGHPEFPDLSDLDIDNERYPFWIFYRNQKTPVIYKILFNYFNAIKNILKEDWMSPYSLLNKTSGYNALIRLLGDVILLGFAKNDLSENFFFELLTPLSKLKGSITSEIYGSSGLYSSNNLYKDMLSAINLPKLSR